MRNTAPPTADFHRAEVHAAGTPFTGLGTLAVGVVTIAALYFGREVFVPLALAVLLSFALGPPVLLLRRWHINRVLAVIAVVVLAFAVIFGIGALIGSQLAHLAENLPGYQTNITEKIHSLRDTTTNSGVVGRAAAMLSDLGNEFTKTREKVGRPAANGPAVLVPGVQQQKPVPVEIRQSDPTPLQPAGRRAAASTSGDGWYRRRLCDFLPAATARPAGPLHSARRSAGSSAHDPGAGRRRPPP